MPFFAKGYGAFPFFFIVALHWVQACGVFACPGEGRWDDSKGNHEASLHSCVQLLGPSSTWQPGAASLQWRSSSAWELAGADVTTLTRRSAPLPAALLANMRENLCTDMRALASSVRDAGCSHIRPRCEACLIHLCRGAPEGSNSERVAPGSGAIQRGATQTTTTTGPWWEGAQKGFQWWLKGFKIPETDSRIEPRDDFMKPMASPGHPPGWAARPGGAWLRGRAGYASRAPQPSGRGALLGRTRVGGAIFPKMATLSPRGLTHTSPTALIVIFGAAFAVLCSLRRRPSPAACREEPFLAA